MKTDAGPWNFQFLLSSAPASAGAMPAIKMRGGRVNFKFGETKSVFYFRRRGSGCGAVDGWVGGAALCGGAVASDRSAQDFGNFFVRGNVERAEGRHEGGAGKERSGRSRAADRPARFWVARRDRVGRAAFGSAFASGHDRATSGERYASLGSAAAKRRRIAVSRTKERWICAATGWSWQSVSEVPNPQVAAAFRAWDFLSAPHWDASAELKQVPVATVLEIARHMGAALPDKLAAEGSLSGEVHYSEPDGFGGKISCYRMHRSRCRTDRPLRAAAAAVTIDHQVMSLEPSTVNVGENESADVEGSFSLDGEARLDLKITTRALSVSDMRSFGVAAIPLLDQTPQGTWRGWARYEWARDDVGQWSGEYELQNARIPGGRLGGAVKMQSAAVVLNGKRRGGEPDSREGGRDCVYRRLSMGAGDGSSAQVSFHDSGGGRGGVATGAGAGAGAQIADFSRVRCGWATRRCRSG